LKRKLPVVHKWLEALRVARLLAVQVAAVEAAAAECVVRVPLTWMAVRLLLIWAEAKLP
jgi:hypothetical protein